MNRHQLTAVGVTLFLILGFYFFISRVDPSIKRSEKSRTASFKLTSIQNIRKSVFDTLSVSDKAYFDGLVLQRNQAETQTEKSDVSKLISGFWYRNGNYALAGDVAEKVASLDSTAIAWSIAGTTYAKALDTNVSDKEKQFCRDKAVKSFENAISIDPSNVSFKTNLAVCYAKLPLAQNPMKGVMMLLDLNKKYPENTGVLLQLAYFGMQTNQLDKAEARLQKVLEIDATNEKAICMFSELYLRMKKDDLARKYFKLCQG